MPTYANGQVPYSVVSVVLASGTDANGYWEFRCTPAFAARWTQAKRNAERLFGRTIYIRTGWNIYRPLFSQQTARRNACAAGNCAGASVPGYSSHGGNWGGRDCLAVDVDPNGLTWDQVDQAMEAAGFSARLITEKISGIPGGERWHYIDFNAFGPAPAGTETGEFDSMATKQEIKDALYEVLTEKPGLGPGERNHWDSLKFIADLAAAAHPSKIWAHQVQLQDEHGNPIYRDGKPVTFPARGYLASINAQVGGEIADVDEEALAAALAPLISSQIGSLSDEDIARLAEAAADEQDRRARERLG